MNEPAQIIMANQGDSENTVWFYRRFDGHPEYQCVKGPIVETLEVIQEWVDRRKIRDNLLQASAWIQAFGWNLRLKDMDNIIHKGGPLHWDANVFWPCPAYVRDVDYLYSVVFSNSFLNSDPWMKWKVFHPDKDEALGWIEKQ